jgi:DNA-binding transcriptional LysR family regulator
MELKHLQQILEICRAGSFSAAARRLKISQPTLSKSIALLEAQLGVKMFERQDTAAHPTEFGLLVAERAEAIVSAVHAVTHDIEQLLRGETGRLRIGVAGTTRLKPLPEVISRAVERFPNLQIEARVEPVAALPRALRAGTYDLVFCYFEAAESYDELIRIRLFEDRHILVARPGHPILDDLPITREKIFRYPIATSGHSRGVTGWAGPLSPEATRNFGAFLSGDSELVKSRPIGSDYLAIGVAFVFEKELKEGSLVELPIYDMPKYECWMLTTEARWRSSVIKTIAEIAKSVTAPPTERNREDRAWTEIPLNVS